MTEGEVRGPEKGRLGPAAGGLGAGLPQAPGRRSMPGLRAGKTLRRAAIPRAP